MDTLTGAELIVALLERQDIRTVAGLPGGPALPLYNALARNPLIRHVLARHEQGAAFIAQGMARVSGRPAVCIASSGPGAINLLTALADAKLDSVPLICITAQVPRAMIGSDAFQEVDTYGLSIPICKHNFLVRSAQELLEVIPSAFRIAASGRPGPVLIDIPKDVQTESITVTDWPEPARPDPAPTVSTAALDHAVELIDTAARPVLYLGGGVRAPRASELARRLAEKAGLPTTMTLMALGALPADHPRALGMLGMHGARYTNMVLAEADLLIACGARFDDRAIGHTESFCPGARIIHIDIDDSEFNKIVTPIVTLHGDAADVLSSLLFRVRPNRRQCWTERVAALKARYPLRMPGAGDPRTPYGLIRAVAALMGPNVTITTDVGQHQMWVAQAYPLPDPRRWLTSGGLGTMGFGLPAAIGAALDRPQYPVVCFTGDGSVLMNIQELATAAEAELDIKIVLMNNNALGLVRQQQELFYDRRLFASTYERRIDFCRIAQGFGVRACDLAQGDARSLLAKSLKRPGPCLINAPIAVAEKVFPMVPPGAPNHAMIGG